jgi:hypothetical protein
MGIPGLSIAPKAMIGSPELQTNHLAQGADWGESDTL